MTEFLGSNLWDRLANLARSSHIRFAAVAYVTDTTIVPFGQGALLVVDASDECISGGQTSALALAKLFERGVGLYSLKHLHAKVFVFESATVVGSANLSSTSRTLLHEAAFLSEDIGTINAAKSYIESLAAATEACPIDRSFIARIAQIPVTGHANSAESSSGDAQDRAPEADLWKLEAPPQPANSPIMHAYFVALMRVQLGVLKVGVPFRLWQGNFSHTKPRYDRIRRQGNGQFVLTPPGVEYFSTGKYTEREDLVRQFMLAITTGCEFYLPADLNSRNLVPL